MRDVAIVTNTVRRHFEANGIRVHKLGTGKGTKNRATVEVGFHSLRHIFVSMCREANAPLSVVEAIVGHSNSAMTRHYTHTSELAAASAVNSLPAVMGKTSALLPSCAEMDPGGKPTKERDDELREIVERMSAKTWNKDKALALAILDGKG